MVGQYPHLSPVHQTQQPVPWTGPLLVHHEATSQSQPMVTSPSPIQVPQPQQPTHPQLLAQPENWPHAQSSALVPTMTNYAHGDGGHAGSIPHMHMHSVALQRTATTSAQTSIAASHGYGTRSLVPAVTVQDSASQVHERPAQNTASTSSIPAQVSGHRPQSSALVPAANQDAHGAGQHPLVPAQDTATAAQAVTGAAGATAVPVQEQRSSSRRGHGHGPVWSSFSLFKSFVPVEWFSELKVWTDRVFHCSNVDALPSCVQNDASLSTSGGRTFANRMHKGSFQKVADVKEYIKNIVGLKVQVLNKACDMVLWHPLDHPHMRFDRCACVLTQPSIQLYQEETAPLHALPCLVWPCELAGGAKLGEVWALWQLHVTPLSEGAYMQVLV